MQIEELPEYDLIWSIHQHIKIYRQHLIQPVLVKFSSNSTGRVKPILAMPMQSILEKFV